MSDHATKAAQAVTHAMSRRGFLGRFAQVAGGLAAGMAGVLATSSVHGAPRQNIKLCCEYIKSNSNSVFRCIGGNKCPDHWRGAVLWSVAEVPDCSYCG